jgi:hypothetical protein
LLDPSFTPASGGQKNAGDTLNIKSCKLTLFSHLKEREKAKVAQLVEHDLAKVGVAGSNPVFRSFLFGDKVIR